MYWLKWLFGFRDPVRLPDQFEFHTIEFSPKYGTTAEMKADHHSFVKNAIIKSDTLIVKKMVETDRSVVVSIKRIVTTDDIYLQTAVRTMAVLK